MRSVNKITMILCCCLAGLLIAFVLHFIIGSILIPDPCAYHIKETTKIFDLFYEMTAAEGFHPSPTRLNYLLTSLSGVALGVFINKGIDWLKNENG